MNDQIRPATAGHVKPTSLICGTLVSTDLKRARHMLEDGFGLQCVEPEPGVMLVRDRGFEVGGARRGQPYWVLEVRQTA